MPDTAALGLPLLVAEQAQKHVTHNEALSLLDALVRTQVVDRDLTAPPGSPAEGAIYIPASGATGDWLAWDFNLAYYVGGAWQKIVPKVGWLAYVIDEDKYYKFEGAPTYWAEFASGGSIGVGDISGVTSQRILGRKTAGSGAGEELTLSEVLDFIGSAAQGDILYRDASGWARLAAGTAGHFLKTQGAAANPVWAAVPGGSAVRELLSADRDYYVRTDGSDSNDGLSDSSGGAFATIQKAVDTVATLDINGKTVTVNVGAGTFTAIVELMSVVGFGAIGNLIIDGAGATTIISTTSEDCFLGDRTIGVWQLQNMKLQTTTDGACIHAKSCTIIGGPGLEFGDCADRHILAEDAHVEMLNDFTISGDADRHISAIEAAIVEFQSGITVTLTGTPDFGGQFAQSADNSYFRTHGVTYSGAATGQRYNVSNGAIIATGGGGASFLPGDSAGSSSTNGLYL